MKRELEEVTITKSEYERLSKIADKFKIITCHNPDCSRGHTLSSVDIKLPDRHSTKIYTDTGVICYVCHNIFCSGCAWRRAREIFCKKCFDEWDSGC